MPKINLVRSRCFKITFGVVLFLFFPLGLLIHCYWLDGITGASAECFLGETKYAPGYREWKFRKIKVGMSEQDVLSIPGEPVMRMKNEGRDIFNYTTWKTSNIDCNGPDCCYTERGVMFRNGSVVDLFHDFYID